MGDDDWLRVVFTLRIGLIETRLGGLKLRDREEFVVIVPPDFPFEIPALVVRHDRFANFPHVVWSRTICLYQSELEWNPADGLFGFFDRLGKWLGKAAINDMDPVDGPLEPPHHVTDFSQVPFVVRSNAPVAGGDSWFGLAELVKYPNRIELVAWHSAVGSWPQHAKLALAFVLPRSLPMEFPKKGSDFFAELLRQGFDRNQIVRDLALAALFTDDNEPIHLVLGIPMRRGAYGSLRLHVAVWTTPSTLAKSLRAVLPKDTDTNEIRSIRTELSDALYDQIAETTIKWCEVLEDRSEIIVRRDQATPAAWFRDKRVLLLGCGALGSWLAEAIARAGPKGIHLIDNSIVKPGLLVRQNYRAEDIGSNKANALASRVTAIDNRISTEATRQEAYVFLSSELARIRQYDVVLDCTASKIFQMKLERDWQKFRHHTPPIISFVIDAKAERCLGIVLPSKSHAGPWDGYIQLKRQICFTGAYDDFVRAFYSEQETRNLFQPEPGCSDPTFSGAACDVLSLITTSLNVALTEIARGNVPTGVLFSARAEPPARPVADNISLTSTRAVKVGDYRVRIAPNVFANARGWVQQNNRVRSPKSETGGLLWGLWDDAIQVIWIFDLSGPPPDSIHQAGHFTCGTQGTADEHRRRVERSHGTCGFVGFWHTHPDMEPEQSGVDIFGMSNVVAGRGENQRRALMLIFGRSARRSVAGLYLYESDALLANRDELISVRAKHIALRAAVV